MSRHTPEGLRIAVSPFKGDLVIPVFGISRVEGRIDPSNIKISDGIITGVGPIERTEKRFLVEKDKHIKIYITNNGEDLKPYFKLLTKEGRLLFDYILLNCLRENKLYIYIDQEEFSEFTNLKSRTTLWTAKKNLLDCAFIAKSAYTGWYWINPKLFFSGERFKCEDLKANIKNINRE